MQDRIDAEVAMLRARFPNLEYQREGQWMLIPRYGVPTGWSASETDAAFQIPVGYPGTPPYGIYVPVGLTFDGQRANNYSEPAPVQPPFGGCWGIFSWAPADGAWRPTANPTAGSNLLNWALGFAERLREGR
ncbi:MAG: hypothetical protein H3C62_01775 [Gemmatimonadaceae bacterium]|nr:hypothetical protein [Gemmatimonadaceae bacterium]